MRISDWSSDVCSSDLHREVADRRQRADQQRQEARGRGCRRQHQTETCAIDDPARTRRALLQPCPAERIEIRGQQIDRVRQAERDDQRRSEEHTSELQSLMRISYAVFCLKKKKNLHRTT